MSMPVLLFIKLLSLVSWLLTIYVWIVIIRAVLSWIRPDPYNLYVRIIGNLVDPVTYRISKIIPTRVGMVDLSPLILIVIVQLVQSYLIPVLISGIAGL
ncbi:MAG TPA: YggT family protein [Syntrophorhabdales bacterium]|nr:YggT family protein [Syntrophorhabdales bacterium]